MSKFQRNESNYLEYVNNPLIYREKQRLEYLANPLAAEEEIRIAKLSNPLSVMGEKQKKSKNKTKEKYQNKIGSITEFIFHKI